MNNFDLLEYIRENRLTGVLLLEGNHSFGRQNKKLLYKCIPSDKRLPVFYIPYEINLKNHSKFIKNKYIQFVYTDTLSSKFHGMITETYGNIDDIDAFYNYQLGKYGFSSSCQLGSLIKKWYGKGVFVEEYYTRYYEVLLEEKKLISKNNTIRDYIISIDPIGSKDLDDAIGCYKDDVNNTTILSVYITCVPLVMNVIHDWKIKPKNSTSVYLPNRVLNMLPKCISENICSLSSKEAVALTGDFIVDNEYNIIDFKVSIELIKVKENYNYESTELLADDKYNYLKNFIIDLNNKNHILNNVHDSHDVVAYLMIIMNKYCAKFLRKHNTGIFRWSTYKEDLSNINDHINYQDIPLKLKNFLELQKYNAGIYGLCDDIKSHDALNLEEYCHITSPIRRLSDLINMILIIKIISPDLLNPNAYIFAESYLNNNAIQLLTQQLKDASNISRKCLLLQSCTSLIFTQVENKEKVFEGYIYTREEIINSNKEYKFKYSVYIPELKYSFNVKSQDNYEICDKVILKCFVFLNNDTLAKKIRVKIINTCE